MKSCTITNIDQARFQNRGRVIDDISCTGVILLLFVEDDIT
jgi:hypothetical protein